MSKIETVYVASPYARHARVRGIHGQLIEAGLTPTSTWAELAMKGPDDTLTAFDVDRADIARSDAMFALLDFPDGKETYCEIEVARTMGIPIVFIGHLLPLALQREALLGRALKVETIEDGVRILSTMPKRVDWIQKALEAVRAERFHQNVKWGRIPGSWTIPTGGKLAVLGEEVGEVSRALLEREPMKDLKKELTQVAAVAVAWIEALEAGETDQLFADDEP